MASPRRVWIALGSNVGDRRRNLETALLRLAAAPGVRVEAASSFHETRAQLAPGEPQQPDYLNAAAELAVELSPRSLLRQMLDIEQAMGRRRAGEVRWSARVIDLDLLLYEDWIIHEPGLVVPHPRMHRRRFVLAPLAEIAPDAAHPGLKRTAAALLAECAGLSGASP